jgi:glycosyltransferase involved in cell wall biosynthesis
LLNAYGPLKNTTFYYNGFPDDACREPNGESERDASKLRVIYAGLLNWEQHPLLLGRALRAVRRRDPGLADRMSFDFYGPRNYYTHAAFALRRDPAITFHDYLPFSEVRSRMRQASMGYTSLISAAKSYCIPSKVFQYLSAGLPLLAISSEGALARFVRRHGFGIHHLPNDTLGIAATLENLAREPHLLCAYRERVELARNAFSLRNQAAKLSEFLEKLVA